MQMITKNIKQSLVITVAAFLLLLGLSILSPTTAGAAETFKSELCGGADLSLDKNNAKCDTTDVSGAEGRVSQLVRAIVNIITTIVGILAVIFIILGGAKYITSGGDSGKITSAKNTVIYALVGLVIVALAQVIVRFVLSKI